MNGKNRHNKYRKSVYRRRNVGVIILVTVICLSVVLTAFLLVGNLLHKQSEKRNEALDSSTDTSNNIDLQDEKVPVRNILGHPVLLETQDSSVFSDRINALTQKGIYEASVPLNMSDGTLLFKSSIANKIGYPVGEAKVTLDKAVQAAKSNKVYLSGIFYVTAFESSDPLVRSVELSRASAIIAEALRSGFDDVVVIAPKLTEAHIEEAIRFTDSIKSLTDGGTVGLCVSEDIFSLDDTQHLSQIISKLNSKIDFLAMDVSSEDISDGYSVMGDKISSMQHYLLMYKMRVLLPNGETSDALSAIISEAESNGIKNMQILP